MSFALETIPSNIESVATESVTWKANMRSPCKEKDHSYKEMTELEDAHRQKGSQEGTYRTALGKTHKTVGHERHVTPIYLTVEKRIKKERVVSKYQVKLEL